MASSKAWSLIRTHTAPQWASKIKNIPSEYLELAQTPTLIHDWKIKNVPNDFKLSIKRDDMTGNVMAGNKIRKLEFIFADVLKKKSTCVITCGGLQSNHCRITAAAASHVGLKCHLLLRSHDQEEDSKTLTGNVLLNRLHGAHCYMVPYESLAGGLNARLEKLSKELRKQGEVPYIIPLGGSNHLGTYGIINSFQELIEQGLFCNYDDIVLSTGSGGTLAGLTIANYLTGEKLRIHGVAVCDNADYFYAHVEETLETYRIRRTKARKICDVIEGYKGHGYSKTTTAELDMLVNICQETGVLLDYCYSLKALKGMLSEMELNPSRFKGKRVLFIHTGGTFSIFDGVIRNSSVLLQQPTHVWNDIDELKLS